MVICNDIRTLNLIALLPPGIHSSKTFMTVQRPDQRNAFRPFWYIQMSPRSHHRWPPKALSISRRSRRLLVLLELQQQFPEALLARAGAAAPRTLAAQVDQLGDALPAGAAGGRVLSRR